MIVRILSEGQYRIDSSYLDPLNEADNRLVEVVANGSDEQFSNAFREMLDLVRDKGEPLAEDELATSDLILPDPTARLEDIKRLFIGEGIIPG